MAFNLNDFLKTTRLDYLVIFILSVFLLSRTIQTAKQYEYNIGADFRTLYLGALLLKEHKNPYDDGALKLKWKYIIANENLEDKIEHLPGLPEIPLLYQPYTLTLFVPFTYVSYTTARGIWLAICIASLLVSTILFVHSSTLQWSKKMIVALLILSSSILFHLGLVGQPAALFTWTGFLSIFFLERNKIVWASFFLFLTAFKSTLAIPFILYFLSKHQWKLLIYSGFFLISIHLVLVFSGYNIIQLYLDNLTLIREYRNIHLTTSMDQQTYISKVFFSTELLTLMRYFANEFYAIGNFVLLMLFTIGILFSYIQYRKRIWGDTTHFLILSVLCLLAMHHFYYDHILLLPICLLFPLQKNKNNWMLVLFIVVLLIPVQRILSLIGDYNILWLYKPVMLLMLLYWLIKTKQQQQKYFFLRSES